jgi:C1A family cysteine protease
MLGICSRRCNRSHGKLYFNQLLHLDLSEQDLLSCSGAGSCSGGYPSTALNYITNTGIVDEVAFPYSATDESCQNKSKNPEELIKIAGRVDFGSSLYPRSEDNLKKMLIEMGPISGGLYDWSHAMTLVGYKVVEEGDKFYYRDLELQRYWITVEAGDPLIGKTVWIFKNSWGRQIWRRRICLR